MAPANRDYMPDSEDDEQQVLIKNLQDQLTKCLDASNPREQLIKVLEKAAILQDLFDLHFRDEEGFTLLGNAVRWHLMDVVKFLVEVKNFKVKEELVIAVEADYRECVEYLIEVRPMLLDRKILAGTTCRPGMTPVMKASLMENESMLKLLFAKGAKPLEIPEYNPREPNNIIRFDAIYRTLVAISKPMYLCVMNEDPVMMAFKIAETCEKIAATLDVAKDDLLEVKDNCEKFASDFIKHADTFEHLELLLSQMTTEDINVVAPGNFLERLKYAMIHNHMDFVANRSVQKLVKKKFYDGPVSIKDFEGANMIKRSLYLSGLVMLTPIWLFLYLIYPASDTPTGKFVKAWMEMPIMRFIVNTVIYVVVGALFVSGGANYALFPLDEFPVAEGVLCLRTTVNLGDYKCLDNNHAFTPEQKELFRDPVEFNNYLSSVAFEFYSETFTNTSYILFADMTTVAWTFGNVYKEFWTIWSDGASTYFSDWVNYLNFLLNICFICGLSLRYSFIINMGYTPRDLFGDEFYHPMQVSEALKALGVLLALSLIVFPFLPASNLLFPVGFVVAERVLYTPSAGFCILVAMGMQRLVQIVKRFEQNSVTGISASSGKYLVYSCLLVTICAHFARTSYRNYDWKDEFSLFISAVKNNKFNAKCWNNVGHSLEQQQRFYEALSFFHQATIVQPDDVGAIINVARTLKNLNMASEAEKWFYHAIELLPTAESQKAHQQSAKRGVTFHGDTEDDDDDGGDGVDMLGSGQPITRMNPNYLYAFISLANMIKEDPLRMDEADKLYQRAYTMRFDQVDAYTNRGELLIRQNRTKEAREMFLRAKMYDEKNPDIWYNLGVTYLLESKQQEAFPLFSKALTLDPTHRRSKYNYASLLLEMQPQLQNSATQVQGGSGFVDAELQQQQMREANYRQAVRLLEQMWAEDEQRGEGRGDHKVALRLANYYIDTNNKEQAVIWHRRAAQLNPKYVKAFALKGDVLAKSGRRKEAIEAFESALEIDPFHLTSGHNLCVNLFNFHQPQVPQHVLDCFEKYIRMAPPGHEIHTHYQWIRSQMKPVQT
ncbi:uncharacterized protein LOC142350017 isoform X2 [Convolutriloba macropyga]|uniref:uncharacterized protein LOC142350017 isoform X2 n=1 Tax=Convolutriloba macropyga TaxID=536237 RepID=UPI003F5225F0